MATLGWGVCREAVFSILAFIFGGGEESKITDRKSKTGTRAITTLELGAVSERTVAMPGFPHGCVDACRENRRYLHVSLDVSNSDRQLWKTAASLSLCLSMFLPFSLLSISRSHDDAPKTQNTTAPQALSSDGQRTTLHRKPASSPYTISHGTTFNVGQGAASNGGGATALQSTAFPFSSSTAAAHWAHMQGNEQKLQKMARQSLLHELWQEQQRTHEKAVDW